MWDSTLMLVQFPILFRGHAAQASASTLDIIGARLREWLGRVLNAAGLPGAIKDMKITDSVTGHRGAVEVGDLHVRFSVEERDFYFDRLTGRFDGTGSLVP